MPTSKALTRHTYRPEVLGRMQPATALAELLRALFGASAHEQPQFMTLVQAREYTGLSVTFLRRLIRAGQLDAIKDRCYKVRRDDLDNLPRMSELSGIGKRLAAATSVSLAARRSR